MKLPHQQLLGKIGEDLAARYLKSHGYKIINRNFKARYGEIDIIAVHQNVLIFVEVKARLSNRFGSAVESITPHKLQELIQTSQYFKLNNPGLPDQMRIDLIAIELNDNRTVKSIVHLENISMR